MTRDELALAVERHATSKLADDDLSSISTLGFRGEALPSIGAVARLSIATRHGSRAARLVDRGRWRREIGARSPAALGEGTRVEVRELFYATPARLKFLKLDAPRPRPCATWCAGSRWPAGCGLHARRRGARAGHLCGGAARRRPGGLTRLGASSAAIFATMPSRSRRARGRRGRGYAGLPTSTAPMRRGNICSSTAGRCATSFWSARCARAYADFLPRDRHPLVALFLDAPAREVDVNVHPAKAEVRFRDAGLVRGLIVRALKAALARDGIAPRPPAARATLAAFRPRRR